MNPDSRHNVDHHRMASTAPVRGQRPQIVPPYSSRMRHLGVLYAIQGIIALAGCIAVSTSSAIFTSSEAFWGIVGIVSFYIAFCSLQYGLLRPVMKPTSAHGAKVPLGIWISRILFGLIAGLLLVFLVFLIGDLTWLTGDGTSLDPVYGGFGTVALVTMIGSWIYFTRYIGAFMGKGQADLQVKRVASRLFLGSIIEVIAAIPISALVYRRTSCICVTFSGITIIFGTALAFLLLGPVVILVLWGWRSRSANKHFCLSCGHDKRSDDDQDRCGECGIGWKIE